MPRLLEIFVPGSALQCVFDSLVQPHFDYCCVVWDNYKKTVNGLAADYLRPTTTSC